MSLQGLKVLVIEDDPIICEHICQLLMIHEANVIGRAHQGLRALDMLHTLSPEFAICDIHLEDDITGIDVAEQIDKKYNIPYIFLTSFDDEQTLKEAQQHSPYGYIVKPFQDRTLLTTMKVALSNHDKQQINTDITKEGIEAKIEAELSSQEFDILKALLEGSTYTDIANAVFLSKDSIKYHAGKIYAKCGIKGRSELAARLR